MSNDTPDDQLRNRLREWFRETPTQLIVATTNQSHVSLGTTVGLKRSENQDRTAFMRVRSSRPDRRTLIVAVVCDGMGGMADGAECADLAISAFLTYVVRSKESNLVQRLRKATLSANDAVFRRFSTRGGATLSAFAMEEGGLCAAVNVGDSRIYKVTHLGAVELLTVDDTIGGQLRAMNKEVPDGLHEYNQLVQFIGMGSGIDPRLIEPPIQQGDDFVLLTSDGAHAHHISTFESLCCNSANSHELVKRLLVSSEWIGGHDNATAISLSLREWSSLFGRPHDTAGVVEIWSPVGKVEFWGLQQQVLRTSFSDQLAQPEPQTEYGISETASAQVWDNEVGRNLETPTQNRLFDGTDKQPRARSNKRKNQVTKKNQRSSERITQDKKENIEIKESEIKAPELDIFISDDGESK